MGADDGLSPQYLPPGQHPLHQWPHAQLAGNGQRLVQQGHSLLLVSQSVALFKGVGVVTSDPGQFLYPSSDFQAERFRSVFLLRLGDIRMRR